MDKALVTYSLIRALYDEGRDYVDAFWPFALRVLPADKTPVLPQTVADLVQERFLLQIPTHTTRTLLERAKRRGQLVSRREQAYALTDAGVTYLRAMETRRNVERRIAAFVEAASVFLAERREVFADRTYTQRMIERVIQRSNELFSFVVEKPPEDMAATFSGDEEAVLAFFRHVEAVAPTHFDTLRDLVLGSTLAGLLRRTDIADATRNFRPTVLYLDTNFLLSVLGLRFPVECRPALELLRLLNQNPRFSLKAFDFTLEEIFGLLRSLSREGGKYPVGVPIASLYASMKSQGWTSSRVTEFISRIDRELEVLGVDVLSTGIRLDDLDAPDADLLSRHRIYKPEQEERGRLHDLQAIAFVAQERTREVRRVEDAEVFFLTEDTRLSNYAFIERGHRDRETISEVMPDRLLTNLLWLKDPQVLAQLPIEAVIAMHSRDLFIDKHVWLRFFGVLEELRSSGQLDDDAASVLLYDGQVHKDLAVLGAVRAHEVTDEWILQRLEDAREQAQWRQDWALKQQAQDLAKRHEEDAGRQADLHRGQVEALQERVLALEAASRRREVDDARTLARIKRRAQKHAVATIRGVKGLLLASVAVAVWFLVPLLVRGWDVADPVISLAQFVGIVAVALGWRVDPLSFWTSVQLRIEEWLIARGVRHMPGVDGSSEPTP